MAATETIRAKLRKIAALAERGVGGERDNAKGLLDRLLARHGLTMEDLYPKGDVEYHEFVCANQRERTILVQCVAKAMGLCEVTFWRVRHKPKRIGIKCGRIDFIEIEHMYRHFRKLLREEEKRLVDAFICRHELYGPSDGQSGAEPLSYEEYMALRRLANGMRDSNYVSTRRMLGGNGGDQGA